MIANENICTNTPRSCFTLSAFQWSLADNTLREEEARLHVDEIEFHFHNARERPGAL